MKKTPEKTLFQSQNESIGKWISLLHRYSRIYMENEFGKYNIGSGQIPFLISLFHNDGLNQEALTGLIIVDKATTARALKKLEKEGYVKRVPDDSDKRAYKVYLTRKGKDLRPILHNKLSTWTALLLTDFSDREKKQLVSYLKRIAQNASAYP